MASNELHFGTERDGDHPDRDDEWARMRAKYILPAEPAAAIVGRVESTTRR